MINWDITSFHFRRPIVVFGFFVFCTCLVTVSYLSYPITGKSSHPVPVQRVQRQQVHADCNETFQPFDGPFYLHYVRFGPDGGTVGAEFRFLDYLSVKSAVLNLKPAAILLHGNLEPTGHYWDELKSKNQIRHVLRQKTVSAGTRWGKERKVAFLEHSADMAKLDVLLEYGGVSADFDVFFVRGEKIKEILKHRRSITCYDSADGSNIGLVAGHKGSKLIWAWRRSYVDIYVNDWSFNQAYVSKYLGVLFRDENYVLNHVCNNPEWSKHMDTFYRDYGKLQWSDSVAIHTYSRDGGVTINGPDDLEGTLTTYKELLLSIYHNRTLPPVNPDFVDEVELVL